MGFDWQAFGLRPWPYMNICHDLASEKRESTKGIMQDKGCQNKRYTWHAISNGYYMWYHIFLVDNTTIWWYVTCEWKCTKVNGTMSSYL